MPNVIILDDTTFNVVAIDNKNITLQFMYDLIGCATVERLPVKVGDKIFDAWFDEEGKFSSLNKPNAIMVDQKGKPHDWLAGRVLFFLSDDEHITPVTDHDAAYFLSKITQYIVTTITDMNGRDHLGHYPLLEYSL
jgi:hypothetical protein